MSMAVQNGVSSHAISEKLPKGSCCALLAGYEPNCARNTYPQSPKALLVAGDLCRWVPAASSDSYAYHEAGKVDVLARLSRPRLASQVLACHRSVSFTALTSTSCETSRQFLKSFQSQAPCFSIGQAGLRRAEVRQDQHSFQQAQEGHALASLRSFELTFCSSAFSTSVSFAVPQTDATTRLGKQDALSKTHCQDDSASIDQGKRPGASSKALVSLPPDHKMALAERRREGCQVAKSNAKDLGPVNGQQWQRRANFSRDLVDPIAA